MGEKEKNASLPLSPKIKKKVENQNCVITEDQIEEEDFFSMDLNDIEQQLIFHSSQMNKKLIKGNNQNILSTFKSEQAGDCLNEQKMKESKKSKSFLKKLKHLKQGKEKIKEHKDSVEKESTDDDTFTMSPLRELNLMSELSSLSFIDEDEENYGDDTDDIASRIKLIEAISDYVEDEEEAVEVIKHLEDAKKKENSQKAENIFKKLMKSSKGQRKKEKE